MIRKESVRLDVSRKLPEPCLRYRQYDTGTQVVAYIERDGVPMSLDGLRCRLVAQTPRGTVWADMETDECSAAYTLTTALTGSVGIVHPYVEVLGADGSVVAATGAFAVTVDKAGYTAPADLPTDQSVLDQVGALARVAGDAAQAAKASEGAAAGSAKQAAAAQAAAESARDAAETAKAASATSAGQSFKSAAESVESAAAAAGDAAKATASAAAASKDAAAAAASATAAASSASAASASASAAGGSAEQAKSSQAAAGESEKAAKAAQASAEGAAAAAGKSAGSAATAADAAASSAGKASTSATQAATSAQRASESQAAAESSASGAASSAASASSSADAAAGSASQAASVISGAKADIDKAIGDAAKAAEDATKAAAKAYQAASHLPVWDEEAGEYTEESIRAWLAWGADGMQYGVDQPLDAVQECIKVLANAGIENPVPSTLLKVGSDPYWQRGPFRWWHVNAHVDDDGTQHVTGIKNFGHFSYEDGRDVFCLAPVRYVSHGVVGGKYRTVNCDMPQAGLSPEPRAYRPDGTLAPYMLRAAFPAGLVDGKPVSRPGVRLWNRTCSHNTMNEKAKLKGKAYSGMTGADMDYLYDMFLLKYANKSSQSVFAGCTGNYEQVAVTVASESSASVVIAKATADKWPVGCAVMVGTTTTANDDRGKATSYDLADQANVLRKEAVGESDVRLVLDCEPFTSAVGQLVSTAPWNPGATLGVQYDGSPTSCTSSREPFVLQGIECMVGAYEILGDILANGMADGWKLFLCADTLKSSTGVTADYREIYGFPSKDADGWSYPMAQVKSGGFYCPGELGASTSTGTGDGVWYARTGVTGAREFLAFGHLGYGSIAGLRCANLSHWPGGAWWANGSRLSCNGRNGVNADEPPKAA